MKQGDDDQLEQAVTYLEAGVKEAPDNDEVLQALRSILTQMLRTLAANAMLLA